MWYVCGAQDCFEPADQLQNLKTVSVTVSGSAGLKDLVAHSIICIYFFMGNPEEKYKNGNSGDLLLTIARICSLLIL